MTLDPKFLIMVAGLALNVLVVLLGLIKVGRWHGIMETRQAEIENDQQKSDAVAAAWRREHEEKNSHAFNRFDDRINSIRRSVYGNENGEALFITRREFNEFRANMRQANSELRDSMIKHFQGVSDLIKTYFERAEEERKRIWERLERGKND